MRRLALVALVCLTFPPAPARAADAAVFMAQVRFQPPDVQVNVGGTVTWSNKDSMAHDVTADDGSFDSSPTCEAATGTGCVAPGRTWAHTFRQAGRFPYHCQLHGSPGKGMTGVVTVG
ncbi:MAG: plastocyanin/azurin family copper-binding protein [Actinomycetota bacterium]|nr:plastocyanin/azurin family copper-binding protein [Actinomycetota bacterium]